MGEAINEPTIDFAMRLSSVETQISAVKDSIKQEVSLVRDDFERVIESHTNVLKRIADKIELALRYQRDSLPINLVMKLFTFFAGLVLTMLGGMLGIKWIAAYLGS